MGITKFSIRRPITALLIIISVIFFGIISFTKFSYELTPDLNMPMYIVATVYPGASPTDVDETVSKKVEERVANLSGAKDLQVVSLQNMSLVVVQYNYDQNMSQAYDDLKKEVDNLKNTFPDKVEDPYIVEMDINSMPSMTLAVSKQNTEDIYNYVTNVFVKEMEKIQETASVDTAGGRERYIKIAIRPEMMARYNIDMSTLASIITSADFTYPAGTLKNADRELNITTQVEYDTVRALKQIPIITGNKRTLYLEDLADVRYERRDAKSVGRYDGKDCMVVSITKNQSKSAIDLSRHVKTAIKNLQQKDPELSVTIMMDQADNILDSLKNVFETMIIAIVLSMIVIYLFFGDINASLIVGTSIPFSIMTALSCMYLSGYSLNMITTSALVAGVGMMVDNSIVVLEACFRAKEEYGGEELSHYVKAAIKSTDTVGFSVFGSTLTTCVVFAPLGFISGMIGQFFKPLGFTIVYCMLASFVSSITIVPLCYVVFKPHERTRNKMSKVLDRLQNAYREVVSNNLKHRRIVVLICVLLVLSPLLVAKTFKTELVPECDEGKIKISISTKPSQKLEEKDKIYRQFEEFVASKDYVEHYSIANTSGAMSMTGSAGGQSLICYLVDKNDREMTTREIVNSWIRELSDVTNCSYDIALYGTSVASMFVMPTSNKFDKYIESKNLKELEQVNDAIKKELQQRHDVSNVTTSLDYGAPMIKVKVDPVLAAAEGFTPALIGQQLNLAVSGKELYDMIIDNETYTVYLEYEKDEYENIDKVENFMLTSSNGSKAMLKDVAEIVYANSPKTVTKYNKMYRDNIKAYYNENRNEASYDEIMNIVNKHLTKNVTLGISTIDEYLNEEFSSLLTALLIAIFLVFVVMASQFESAKYSLLVMGTVLFAMVGAVYALWFAAVKLSLIGMLSLMLLIGTAVNNGILYVDTANQLLDEGYDRKIAIVEAGAIRIRPMMMTTITTVVSVIPMALAYGNNGELLQSLGLVTMGGLITSTIGALLGLPILYDIFSKNRESMATKLAVSSKIAIKSYEKEKDARIISED